jgi:heme exporter protein A
MLEVLDLECTRGDRRLITGLGFTLDAGELLHLRGHNGSGKTTLMRTVCGLIMPTRGKVCWGGNEIRKIRETFNRELVYIGHKNAIKADLTGTENLRVACRLDGLAVSDEQARQALEQIGMNGHEDLPCRVLSQGQQRRVTLARLLVSPAPLWVLDEPFTALDQAAVSLLQSVIQQHLDRDGMVLLTTHQEVALTRGEVKQLRLGWKRDGDV